jgi:hypothetical protein
LILINVAVRDLEPPLPWLLVTARRQKRKGGQSAMTEDVTLTDVVAEEATQAELQRQIAEAGWHILRDEEGPDGFMVEFQRGTYEEFHPGAETLTIWGASRTDAYRRFLAEFAAETALSAR